jgi:hypothetical protein
LVRWLINSNREQNSCWSFRVEITQPLPRPLNFCKLKSRPYWRGKTCDGNIRQNKIGSKIDRNTQYFHSWANHRRKTNSIRSITNENGWVWRKKKEVSRTSIKYYKQFFTSQGPACITHYLEHLECLVTEEMNSRLLRPFTVDKVCLALSRMHPIKSPGLDEYSAIFYQKSWDQL